mmetsp:Transcript_26457/g.70762  ORF Transcript_26457/g.70762 Transcript_26457/m.70762 type:complete len:250 (+) Transcript_26457:487-1236(+)
MDAVESEYWIAGNDRVVYPVDSAWRPADDEDQRIVLEPRLKLLQLLRLLVAEGAAGRAPVSAKDGPHSIVKVRYENHNDPNRHVQDEKAPQSSIRIVLVVFPIVGCDPAPRARRAEIVSTPREGGQDQRQYEPNDYVKTVFIFLKPPHLAHVANACVHEVGDDQGPEGHREFRGVGKEPKKLAQAESFTSVAEQASQTRHCLRAAHPHDQAEGKFLEGREVPVRDDDHEACHKAQCRAHCRQGVDRVVL